MRKIYIEDIFFNFGNKMSEYLISSLVKMSQAGYEIYFSRDVFENREYLRSIFKMEKIKYKITSVRKGKEVIGAGCRNLSDAVENLSRKRCSEVKRKTNETDILIKLNLDGKGTANIKTGIGFFDHMMDQIARHANIDLDLNVSGDLAVDEHHTVEDTGLAFGEAILKALGAKNGIQRYGFIVPMDDSVSVCSIDLSGRSYLNFECSFKREKVGGFPTELTEEFFRGVSAGLKAAIYMKCKGKNEHHKIESMFKAFAKSLNEACRLDERNKNSLPSTKGVL